MKTIFFFILTILIFVFFSKSNAQLAPDSTFGQNGYFITSYPGLGTFTHKIHELSNGDLLAIGTFEGNIRIWKYNAIGQLITSFGSSGIANNAALDAAIGNMETIYDYEIYDNGKIMVLSKLSWFHPTNYDSSTYSIALSSFNADGSINTSFNGSGFLIDNPSSLFEFNPYAILMDKKDSNDFYVGGEAYEKGHSTCPTGTGKWFISKYNINGSADLSFNGMGYILESTQVLSLGTTVLYPHGRLRDLAFMSNGSIRAVGAFHNFDKAFFDFAVKPDGTFDISFGVGGVTKYDVTYNVLFLETGTWSKILNDGSVLFYTTSFSGTNSIIKFTRHKVDGSIDSSYGINGLFTLTVPTQTNYRLIYKSDNSILLTYYQTYGSDQKIEFMRIKPEGKVDSTFGIAGLLKTQPITPDVYINPSSIFDGIWNSNETCVFLAAAKQPVLYSNYGIFKYKWPGLTPLLNEDRTIDVSTIVYPNPVLAGKSLYMRNLDSKDKIKIISLDGKILQTTIHLINDAEIEILIPSSISRGTYYLSILSNKTKTAKTIPLLIQ